MKSRKSFYYDKIEVNPKYGGYSDIRLWPCYMVFSGLALFLAPLIGMLPAIIVLGIPAFAIATILAGGQPKLTSYDFDSWNKDCDALFNKGLSNPPELRPCELIEQKPTTIKVAKRNKTIYMPIFKKTTVRLTTSINH